MTDTTTTFAATAIYPAMELHKAGCADIARTMKQGWTNSKAQAESRETFRASSIVKLIVAIDKEFAAMFGEAPYTESALDNGCWTAATAHQAPCFKEMLKGIEYNGTAAPVAKSDGSHAVKHPAPPARPRVQRASEAVAYSCKGKWSQCGGANERSMKANWNLCPDCTDKRAAAMAAR